MSFKSRFRNWIYNYRMFGTIKGGIGLECEIKYIQNIEIGKNTYINGGKIYASPNAKIIIGNNTLISYNVHLRTDSHRYQDADILINKQGHVEKDIFIKDDVWIGAGAQIMAGITIETGCVIGAGSVVTKSTRPYGVYAGVPAKLIKSRE